MLMETLFLNYMLLGGPQLDFQEQGKDMQVACQLAMQLFLAEWQESQRQIILRLIDVACFYKI